jgi:hypothetical protein
MADIDPNVTAALATMTTLTTSTDATVASIATQALAIAQERQNGEITAEEGAAQMVALRQENEADMAVVADEDQITLEQALAFLCGVFPMMQ